jgi:hypothetical protein
MDIVKSADRDMSKRACCDCKHYKSSHYSLDCTRKEYGPQPDEWSWSYLYGWRQSPAPVVRKYDDHKDNSDGHCPGFEEKPPKIEAPAAPEPTTGEKLVALLYEIAAEAQEA